MIREERRRDAKQRCSSATEEEEREERGRAGGNCRMESSKQQCVGTTGSISVKQPFQKALMAEGKMKQQSKQVHVRCLLNDSKLHQCVCVRILFGMFKIAMLVSGVKMDVMFTKSDKVFW